MNIGNSGSQFHDNIAYGFDPHDRSNGFVVTGNQIYNNGKHGIIFFDYAVKKPVGVPAGFRAKAGQPD